MANITLTRKPGHQLKQRRSAIAQWLQQHPGPQRKYDALRALDIPLGNSKRIFDDPQFVQYANGRVELRNTPDEPALTRRRLQYAAAVICNAREMVFTELTVQSPQTVEQLMDHLKVSKGLIMEALSWKRFAKVRGGWVILPKSAKEAQLTEPEQ